MFKKHNFNQNQQKQNFQNQNFQQKPQRQFQYDTLQQICSMGFPFNNLITFSLVQRLPQMNGQQIDQKEKLFFFLTMVPGVGNKNNRTYDFKQRVTQKFATREIAGLYEILYQCTIGNEINVLPYVKYTSSGGQYKSLSVWVSSKKVKIGQNNLDSKVINITILSGESFTIALSPDQALGMSHVLKEMVKKAINLEFEIQFHQPKLNNSTTMNQGVTGMNF